MLDNVQINLVMVQYESRWKPGTFTGKEFSYIDDVGVQPGDVVNAPTKYGDKKACVSRINVPISEIGCKVGELRHITEPPTVTGGMFDGFF